MLYSYRLKPQLSIKQVGSSQALFDLFSGDTHFLDNNYSAILKALTRSDMTIDDLAKHLSSNSSDAIDKTQLTQLLSEAVKSGIIIESHRQS